MYMKIHPSEDQSDNPFPKASYIFECDHYSINRIRPGVPVGVRDDHLGLYWETNKGDEPDPVTEFTKELWLYGGDHSVQILLYGAVVFVMNNNGKTIDKIYT